MILYKIHDIYFVIALLFILKPINARVLSSQMHLV